MTMLNEMERERDSLRAFVEVGGDAVESDDIRRLLDLDAQISDARAAAAAASIGTTGQSVLDAMRAHRAPAVRLVEQREVSGIELIRKGLTASQSRGS
ncbi:hypothetical protein [Azospirillum melinis]